MLNFTVAFTLVWLGTLVYLVRLGIRQRRLSRAFEAHDRQRETAIRRPVLADSHHPTGSRTAT